MEFPPTELPREKIHGNYRRNSNKFSNEEIAKKNISKVITESIVTEICKEVFKGFVWETAAEISEKLPEWFPK